LFDQAAFEDETVTLQPGDRVVVFSDGLIEAWDEGWNQYGDDRLLATIEAHRKDSPRALLEALTADVRTFYGRAPAADDLTLLVVQFDATAGT
jgi:sigma-B regulation protein RsbU (phosphoserine phosphatase)